MSANNPFAAAAAAKTEKKKCGTISSVEVTSLNLDPEKVKLGNRKRTKLFVLAENIAFAFSDEEAECYSTNAAVERSEGMSDASYRARAKHLEKTIQELLAEQEIVEWTAVAYYVKETKQWAIVKWPVASEENDEEE